MNPKTIENIEGKLKKSFYSTVKDSVVESVVTTLSLVILNERYYFFNFLNLMSN